MAGPQEGTQKMPAPAPAARHGAIRSVWPAGFQSLVQSLLPLLLVPLLEGECSL